MKKRTANFIRWIPLVLVLVIGLGPVVGCGGDDEAKADTKTSLTISTEPPQEVVAGAPFEVAASIVDGDDQPVDMGGVEISMELSRGVFANGDSETSWVTNPSGVAEFELVIEQVDTSLLLTASTDSEDVDEASTTTDLFNVVASKASPDNSSIEGQDGTVADGQETAEITIELFDEFENPVTATTPQFGASGNGNEYHECSETDGDGVATCQMSSTEHGHKTLQITEPVEVSGGTIEFLISCDRDGVPFGGGDGSGEDPFRLCTPSHLNAVTDGFEYMADDFVLVEDIDMAQIQSDDFHPIGTIADPFTGQFDGAGFIIENLTLEFGDLNHIGLFGYTGDEAVISNTVVKDVDVTGNVRVGGLVGTNQGMITDSYVTGKISANSYNAGGLVGNNGGTIIGSYSSANIDTEDWRVGGLVGWNQGSIGDCYATGSVAGGGGERYIGGLVGDSTGSIANSYATGEVLGESESTGGLVGRIDDDATLLASYWDEETTGRDHGVGEDERDGGVPMTIQGITTDEFADEGNFSSWDFDDRWTIGQAPDSYQRPIFQ